MRNILNSGRERLGSGGVLDQLSGMPVLSQVPAKSKTVINSLKSFFHHLELPRVGIQRAKVAGGVNEGLSAIELKVM